MARIRSLKPGFCKSEAIAALSIPCELHFAKLWTYCDDAGRGKDNARLIKAECWPLRDEVSVEQIEEWQCELETNGRIIRYEVEGRRYFEVVNWTEHQKPQHPKASDIPPPITEPTGEEDGKAHEASPEKAPVVGEGEGVGEVVGEGVSPERRHGEDFRSFWETYPRHHQTGKPGGGAPKAKTSEMWMRLKPDERAACLRAVTNYAEALSHPDAPFPAMATTWLNQKRWQDWQEPADPTQARGKSPPRDRFVEMAERFERREVRDGQTDGIIDAARRGLPAGSRH